MQGPYQTRLCSFVTQSQLHRWEEMRQQVHHAFEIRNKEHCEV